MDTKLKTLRTALGLSQTQLAEKSGVHKMQISRIERGDIKLENISLVNGVALATALGTTAEALISAEQ